jgi:MSHA biogenesis protein MshI
MLQTNWLRVLPWRALGRGRRTSEQVGVYRTSTALIAARVRLDGDAGCSVEKLEAIDLRGQREQVAVAHLAASGILSNAPVTLVLGPDQYNTFPLPAPSVPPGEMRDALRWKLRDVLPYAPEDAVIDFVRLAHAVDSNAAESLLAVAAQRRSVAQSVAPLLAAGADVQAVDIAEMAQRNLLIRLPGGEGGRALLGLDESSALLTVVHQGALCLARRIQIPRSQTIEEEDPEHVAARIATQVQRSLEVVERQSGLAPVRTLWIGPHPYCALIARCTSEQTGLECLQLDLPQELRFAAGVAELPQEHAGSSPIAIGAALRTERAATKLRAAPQSFSLAWLSRLKAA